MKTICSITIIIISMLIIVACSSTKNEVGGKVADTTMNEISQHIPGFAIILGLIVRA